MLDFAAVGDNCIDRYLPPIGLSLVGGNAINVGVQLSRIGHRVAYFGAVGDDADGRRTLKALADNRVDIANAETRPGITAYTDIAVDASGDRFMAFEEFGVCAEYRPSEADLERILAAGHVHIGWLADGGALRRTLSERGVSVSQDVSVNAGADNLGVAGLSVAFASAGADRAAGEALAARLLADGAVLAVVTLGSLGSLATDGRETVSTTIRTVEVVDTTGAGDSFIAGFLSARSKGLGLQACLEAGREVAAVTCTHVGGFRQEPMRLL